jgi:hypothetical protein
MLPEATILRQSIAMERGRLLERLWQDIIALRQLVDESQQIVNAARPMLYSRAVGPMAALRPPAEQDTSA